MADPKTWIDVVDTAVKVGLGALIGGGFSYLVTRFEHGRVAKAEFAKRRLDMIERANSEVSEFNTTISRYWANLANGVYERDKHDSTLSTNDLEALRTEEMEVFNSYSVLQTARTKFILLSEKAIVKKIDTYKETCDEFFKIGSIDNRNCSNEALKSHMSAVQKSRSALMEAIGDSYAYRA